MKHRSPTKDAEERPVVLVWNVTTCWNFADVMLHSDEPPASLVEQTAQSCDSAFLPIKETQHL